MHEPRADRRGPVGAASARPAIRRTPLNEDNGGRGELATDPIRLRQAVRGPFALGGGLFEFGLAAPLDRIELRAGRYPVLSMRESCEHLSLRPDRLDGLVAGRIAPSPGANEAYHRP